MATNEQLLELSTRGAVVRMVNDANQTLFDGSPSGALSISPPLSMGGIRTEVELSIRRRINAMEEMPYQGRLAFRYNRLDVSSTLEGSLDGYRPPLPTSTQVLLDELTSRTGIRFETDDFVLEDIIITNAAPYVLKAKSESLRWVGQMEVHLVDLVDLGTYLPPGLPVQPLTISFHPTQTQTRDLQPYLNATAHRSLVDACPLNTPVATSIDPLVNFIRQSVGPVGQFFLDSPSPWVVSPTPAPYNLHGAVLVSRGELNPGLNALVPAAKYVARVRLSALDQTYDNKELVIPYGQPTLVDSEFNDLPRLKATAVVNASNGTPWKDWLNSLPAPSIIRELPTGLDLRFSGPDRWIADPTVRSPTNLYNAVVQYNGQRRTFDVRPYHSECNRVLVVTMSEANSAYQGNLTFHYRAPIIIDEAPSDAELNGPYSFALNPREGTAPYQFQLVSGGLLPGHSLTADHRITGEASIVGRATADYDVRDATGKMVRYSISYRSVVGPLRALGTPPEAVRGQSYEYTFEIQGGVADYSYRLLDPQGAGGLTLPNAFLPRVVGQFSGAAGIRTFALEVTDSVGTIYTHTFSIFVA